jgi:small subunit ribosomal protein S6
VRNYELTYIADPELNEDSLAALEERVHGWIEAADGKIIEVERWGKRRLAYLIDKKPEGFYYVLSLEMPPTASSAIERDLRLSEQILRYLITVKPQQEAQAP